MAIFVSHLVKNIMTLARHKLSKGHEGTLLISHQHVECYHQTLGSYFSVRRLEYLNKIYVFSLSVMSEMMPRWSKSVVPYLGVRSRGRGPQDTSEGCETIISFLGDT